MATFAPQIEQWRDLVRRFKEDLPEDYLLASMEEESGGNLCSTGIPGVEAGLFQTYHPSDDRFGATFQQLRAMCSGAQQIRPATEDEKILHIVSGVNLHKALRERARRALGAVGASWSEFGTDFWNFVKLGHGLPAMQTDLLQLIASSLGRAPSDWAEFRNVTMSMSPGDFPPSLVGFASSASTAGRQNRIDDVLANAEHAGQYGGGLGIIPTTSAILILGGAAALLYYLIRRRR